MSNGFYWFVLILLVCGATCLYLRSWQRDWRKSQAWWEQYEIRAQRSHETMRQALQEFRNTAIPSRVEGCPWMTGGDEHGVGAVRCGRPTTHCCIHAPDTCERHKSSCCVPKGDGVQPDPQGIFDDLDELARRRASELLAAAENASLQRMRVSAFCLGYQAGIVDHASTSREQSSTHK